MTENNRPSRPKRSHDGKPHQGRKPAQGRDERPRREGERRDGVRRDAPRIGDSRDTPRHEGERSRKESTDRPFRERSDRERKPGEGRPREGRPSGERRPSRPGEAGSSERPRRAFDPARPGAGGAKAGASRRDGGPGRETRPRVPREREARDDRDDAPRHNDPAVDADALPGELDRAAWRELKALTKENAEWVAGHLVMASRVIDDDPERAHAHALAAARRAGRIPVVRETVGITAYLTGDFALALRELRTYRRLSGSNDQLPLMVDCERGLGRPDRALELAADVPKSTLPIAVQVELAIARSGARLDMNNPELALAELEIAQLTPDTAYSFSPALFDSYAVVLAELGRDEEAALWGERANRAASALAVAAGEVDDDSIIVVEMDEDE
jgi:hypothetical protein